MNAEITSIQRWTHLPPELRSRALAIYQVVNEVYPVTDAQWLDGSLYDLAQYREIALWEGLTARLRQAKTRKERKKLFKEFLRETPIQIIEGLDNN